MEFNLTKFFNEKSLLLLILLIVFTSMSGALYKQHIENLAPCVLCIVQRYSFIMIGVSSLLVLIQKNIWIKTSTALIAIFFCIMGILAAIKNILVQYNQEISCGRDKLEEFINALPTAKMVPDVFYASGFCGAPIPPLFGISLPMWSLIANTFIFIFLLFLVKIIVNKTH